jgi:hypothetical protein
LVEEYEAAIAETRKRGKSSAITRWMVRLSATVEAPIPTTIDEVTALAQDERGVAARSSRNLLPLP